ncbi:MAG: hypothetical protein IIY21_25390 [Clostridiales bacterium]|nr:hypothetical protein [Clostridiales bacterium]
MAIDDNTSYELTGAQVKDLANKIKAKADDNIFVGATSAVPGSKGIVPAPQAGDDTKFLSGDGTWKTAGGGDATKVFYITAPLKNLVNSNFYIYTDAALTQAVDFVDFSITLRHSPAKLVYNAPSPNQSFSSYDIFIAGDDAFNFQDSDAECSRYYAIGDDGYPDYGIMKMYSISFCNSFASISRVLDFQPKLTAGTGINIDANNVISATGGGGQGGAVFYTTYKDNYNHNSIWEDTPGSNIKLLDSDGNQISAQQLYIAYADQGSVNINGCIDPNIPTTPQAATSIIHVTNDNVYYYFWMVIVTNNGGNQLIRCLKAQMNAMYFSLDHDIPLQSGGGGGMSSILLYATDRSQYLQGHSQFQGRPYPNYLVLFPKQPVANTTNLLIKVDDLKAIDITGSRIYVSCDFQQEQLFSSQYSGYVYGEIIGYAHTTRSGTQEGFLFMYPGQAGRCFSRAITNTVENGTGAVLWELNSAF